MLHIGGMVFMAFALWFPLSCYIISISSRGKVSRRGKGKGTGLSVWTQVVVKKGSLNAQSTTWFSSVHKTHTQSQSSSQEESLCISCICTQTALSSFSVKIHVYTHKVFLSIFVIFVSHSHTPHHSFVSSCPRFLPANNYLAITVLSMKLKPSSKRCK